MVPVRYEDYPVITLHVRGIHPSGHINSTLPVQWQPPCNDMVRISPPECFTRLLPRGALQFSSRHQPLQHGQGGPGGGGGQLKNFLH